MSSEHTPKVDPSDVGGTALLAGFMLIVAVLYARTPAAAVDTATSGVGPIVYFIIVPALGLATGIYAYAGGPYRGIPLFCLGSYLGVFGVGLTAGTLAAASTSVALFVGGVTLIALAVVAIVASVLQLFGSTGASLTDLSQT